MLRFVRYRGLTKESPYQSYDGQCFPETHFVCENGSLAVVIFNAHDTFVEEADTIFLMWTEVCRYERVKDNINGFCIRLAFGRPEDNCIWGSGVVTGSI